MTERFWTPERKKHYYKLAKNEEKKRTYHREYMTRQRNGWKNKTLATVQKRKGITK